jgi:hypothetical protein
VDPQSTLSGLRNLFGRITVNSAANASLWLCVISLVCFVLAYLSNEAAFRWALFAIGVLPIANALVTQQRFLWKEPRYLRSEDHHLRSQLVERLGDETNQLEIVQALLNPPPTTKPPPAIEHKPDE